MRQREDQDTIEALNRQKKSERKNYTFRLSIYLAQLFAEVCREKGVQPVTLLEQWITEYAEPYEDKYSADILSEIDDKIKVKKDNEMKSRKKQNRKRS